MINKTKHSHMVFSLAVPFLVAAIPGQAVADWEPNRTVEFIAMYGPGGGHDIMMRTSSEIMLSEGIVDANIQVRNISGGAGARAMEYLHQRGGESHYLSAATGTFITTPLQGGTDLHPSDFTPIALLGQDVAVLLVRADSDYSSIEDVLEEAANRPMNFGATAIGGQGHLIALDLADQAGVDFNYIPYDGDGELPAALLGNQVEVISANFNTAYDFIETGDFIAVAVSAENRLQELSDTPTLEEVGYDVTITLPRAIIGPPDMPEEATEYWISAFQELEQNERWKSEYVQRYNLYEGGLYGQDLGDFLVDSIEFYRDTLVRGGILEE